MERLYLILFLILIGAFIYWYRYRVLIDMHRKKIITKKSHKKKHKKSKYNTAKYKNTGKNIKDIKDTENSESSGSVIRRKKQNYKKAYVDEHDGTITQDSLSMDDKSYDSADSSRITLDTHTNDSSNFLSRHDKR